ncbi:MAG TPA: TolC family protein [Bacteroidales bacterium]|nr:TolC family protein [Bacteroidales bacterium]
MKKTALIFTLLILTGLSLTAQRAWTLEECIDHAFENNIQIRQFLLGVENAEISLQQSKMNMLPNLNAYVSYGWNWGQAIDRFTNQFATERVQSNNFYGQSVVTLFGGLQKMNTVRQNQLEVMASKLDADEFLDNVALNIATAYLQILYAMEMLEIATNQLDITRQQVQRTEKLVEAGTLARGDLLMVEAQAAAEELQVVDASNNLNLAYLTLAHMLDMPSAADFRIVVPEIELYENQGMTMTPEQIYKLAVVKRPAIKSAELKVESANRGLAVARGGKSPSLSMTASWGTGFSGAQKIGKNPVSFPIQIGYVEKTQTPVYSDVTQFGDFMIKPFWDQLEDNNNRTINFSLNIPIFNGWSTRSNISRAQIAIENAQYEHESARLQLNKTIQQAWADASSSLKRYAASNKKVEATEESFRYAEQRFNVGMLTALDFNNSKNELQRAQSELLQAKFDYVFKTKVLDFYMGIPITL